MLSEKFELSIVIPLLNEKDNIPVLYQELLLVLKDLNLTFEIIFVDDGSNDNSWEIINTLHKSDDRVKGISFSKNFGHQSALRAGLTFAEGDCIISMDADMQHPPALIVEMIEKWQGGFDIVYTQREKDKNLPFFKAVTSKLFYRIINSLSDVHIEDGAADFRLIDRKVADLLKSSEEINIFLRGYISWIGFKQYKIVYKPASRFAGVTKYNPRKMFNLAMNGITSFSVKPLRFSIICGICVSFIGFIYALYAVYISVFTDKAIQGWTSILVSVLFLGGIQLIVLGILGEYLGKLFMQSKHRPEYIVNKTIK
jgi:polyisoprenyl-phosphate glycosyltransferase